MQQKPTQYKVVSKNGAEFITTSKYQALYILSMEKDTVMYILVDDRWEKCENVREL